MRLAQIVLVEQKMANGRKLPSHGVKLKSDRWRLVTPLGEGAYGQTWLAQDNVTDEKVAIKVIPVESQQVNMVPFIKQEVRMLQSVTSKCRQNHVTNICAPCKFRWPCHP